MKHGKSEASGHPASGMDQLVNCPFCDGSDDRLIPEEPGLVYAIADRFPVTPGHTLIIPRRHCADYFLLTSEE